MTHIRAALAALALSLSVACSAAAEESHSITLRNHTFEPSTLAVKAGEKIKLTITNAQEQAAEFESHELNREKVIAPGASAVVYIGPLSAGTYGFFDDFHAATKGRIVAK